MAIKKFPSKTGRRAVLNPNRTWSTSTLSGRGRASRAWAPAAGFRFLPHWDSTTLDFRISESQAPYPFSTPPWRTMELLYLMGVAGALGVVHVFYRKLTRTPASDRDLRKEHAVRLFRCVFVVTGVSMAGLSVLTLSPEAYSSQEASGVAMAQRHFFAMANAFHATAFLALTQLAATLLVAAAAEDRVQVKSGGGGGDELGVNDGHGHASAETQYIAGSQKQSLLTLPMYCWLV